MNWFSNCASSTMDTLFPICCFLWTWPAFHSPLMTVKSPSNDESQLPTCESLFPGFIFLYHMSYQIRFAQKNRKHTIMSWKTIEEIRNLQKSLKIRVGGDGKNLLNSKKPWSEKLQETTPYFLSCHQHQSGWSNRKTLRKWWKISICSFIILQTYLLFLIQ